MTISPRVRNRFLLLLPILVSGCAGAIIKGVRPGDAERAELMVSVEAHELFDYRQPNAVTAHYMGYISRAPVPVQGGPQPERFEIALNEWAFMPEVARLMNPRLVEIQYLLGSRIIRRQRFPSPWDGPGPIAQAIERARLNPGGRQPERPRQPAQPAQPVPDSTVGTATTEISGSLDAPTVHRYPQDLVCRLEAASGPRYLRLSRTPAKLVQLTIDVKSHGDPRATSEVTWWSVELLDEQGRPLPHMEKEMVDVGGEFRHITEWRFDGSPVIFKLQSGSDAGDTLRIRFREVD
jgi:hypothetical protein